MADNTSQHLNDVYKEICDQLGMETAVAIHRMFKGQQISFPIRFYHPDRIKEDIISEYNGSNTRELAIKYDYSEKTIRRIIKSQITNNHE